MEDFCSGEEGGKWEENTPTVCIGGAALHGRSSFGGLLKDLVRVDLLDAVVFGYSQGSVVLVSVSCSLLGFHHGEARFSCTMRGTL